MSSSAAEELGNGTDDMSWVVHKFGGTSVGDADCMRTCIAIIRPVIVQHRVAMVVSAIGGKPKVTDLLLELVHAAAGGRKEEMAATVAALRAKHLACAESLLAGSEQRRMRVLDQIDADIADIQDLLRAVQLMRVAHEQILELVSGYGEIWAASLLAEALQQEGLPFVFLNARDVLLVEDDETVGTKVLWADSALLLQRFLAAAPPAVHLIITGYIASTPQGVATTLKRDGSDFSASIFGKLLKAAEINIWTDVSGVYSADPRRVPEAQIIPEVSYAEAIELAYFGAKVIHPKTMAPAIEARIPIFIRNSFAPSLRGTRISSLSLPPPMGMGADRATTVCGFTTVDGIALLNIEATDLIGVPGIAHRLFGALKAAHITVLFIAQASSEHNICFATRSCQAAKAQAAVSEAFFFELKQGHLADVRCLDNCSIIAAVGESMSSLPGVAGRFFGALGGASINILSISQGCDERNIAAVVFTKDATRALRAVHGAFLMSALDVNIAIVGTGRVGSALLQTLLEQTAILESRLGIKLSLRAVSNSRKMLLGEGPGLADVLKSKMRFFQSQPRGTGISTGTEGALRKSHSNVSLRDLEMAMAADADGQQAADLDALFAHLLNAHSPHTIVIDATTSSEIAARHPLWLRAGAHVVTANKRALSASLDLYNAVYAAARAGNRMYMSEVTIGAALPVRTTLNDILCSGDAVHAIVGLMSVSTAVVLTYISDEGMSFSEAVAQTHSRGLFEDDPFTDLDGSEAASKLLILARELGLALRLEDIAIEPLAVRRPVDSWEGIHRGGALCFAAEDADIRQRLTAAAAKGCTLRYVQRIECDPPAELGHRCAAKASVRLEEVALDSPYAQVKGPVYHFSFHTARFAQHPLIVQGPLSDSATTASGIVGDILRIARSLGAKDRGREVLA